MSRIIVVSNRMSVSIEKHSGEFHSYRSVGGLATGIASLPESLEKIWIGWPGIHEEEVSQKEKKEITETLRQKNCYPVFVPQKQFDDYYEGFANKTIWPLFHYFTQYCIYDEHLWQAYKQVNQLFCDKVTELVVPDDYIWVHDYQLMLLPGMLRQNLPAAKIGFFLHIPFPSFELFRLIPYRSEILEGLLGADLVGLHTYDYVRHFISSACRIAGLEHNLGKLSTDNRIVKVDAFPMGINYNKYRNAINNGVIALEISGISKKINQGDKLEINIEEGCIKNLSTNEEIRIKPLPEFIKNILDMGGLIPSIKRKN